MESGANVTILVNLIRQILALCGRETQASEEFRSAREQASATHAMLLRLREQRLHQVSTTAFALLRGRNSDGADLRQVRAIEMERAAANNRTAVFQNHEIAYVLANLGQVSGQKGAIASVGGYQTMNPLGVRENCFTRAHGSPPGWIRFSVEHQPSLAALLPEPYPRERRGSPAPTPVSEKHRNPD